MEKTYDIRTINDEIIELNEFYNGVLVDVKSFSRLQPERSKREDPEMGCGALNTMET